jgi:hypothetical protein
MLFYYTRGAFEDRELMSRLQEKVILAKETVGWDFVIAGLLDHNTYTRMVTVGLPLAVLPRRESTCAHIVNQPPGVGCISSHRFSQLLSRADCILPPQHGGGLAVRTVTTCSARWPWCVCWGAIAI